MAFTNLCAFMLTTDGRLFSWGFANYCLGRSLHTKANKMNIPVPRPGKLSRLGTMDAQSVEIAEVIFEDKFKMVKIAAGT